MFVLYLDIGNSRIKWAYRAAGGQWCSGGCSETELAGLEWPQPPERVVVSCVRSHPELQLQLQQRFAERLTWLSAPLPGYPHFVHCYSDSQRLGVDRWLAMLGAARHCCDDVLVIDAGTALTLDLLNKQHHHLGGWIVAGLQLAQRALFSQTERVNPYADEAESAGTLPGQDTLGCVSAGARRQALALVASVLADYPQHRVYICGGDGEWLVRELELTGMADVEIHHAPHLIFDGMESLCAGSFLL